MSDLRADQVQVQGAKASLREADETLYELQNRLRYKQNQLAGAIRQGEAGVETAQALEREVSFLESQVSEARERLGAARETLAGVIAAFPSHDRPWDLVEQLDDRLPFLLFPVRLETRFMTADGGKQLWVRIFPDDIAAHSHERALSAEEVQAGKTYWREAWTASLESDVASQEAVEKGAWRALAEAFGGARAAWVAIQTEPNSLDVASPDDLIFPDFDIEALKEESWSRAPRTDLMPDRFVVMGFSGGEEIFRVAGNPIPDPLFLGPDPQKLEDEYRQEAGELLVGEDIAWIYDFDRAVQSGVGLRIRLDEPHASQGLDRLVVLGLRLSADERESQAMLEELFENHRFSPDGMSLVPQGTPTNNTAGQESGFSSLDPRAEASFEVEKGDVLFEPTDEPTEIRDGQRLAESLGISPAPLQRLQNADRRDILEAMLMNKALWHGTLGYYLEELLELDLTTIGLLREFFTGYVTGRGPLPAIRVGTQPYGLLLTSDFSAWKGSRALDGDRFQFLETLHKMLSRAEAHWRELLTGVAHIGAAGDAHENLLATLGLHATSVEFHRRHALGRGVIWNYAAFRGGAIRGNAIMANLRRQALELLRELGLDTDDIPELFKLTFLKDQDEITDPLVDDIPAEENELLSETQGLRESYQVSDPGEPGAGLVTNYIGWLAHSTYQDLKSQRFEDPEGETLPVPRPLLYRMLRGALLQTQYDATMQLYNTFERLPEAARREVELSNVRPERTVTRWEFMDADVSRVLADLGQESMSVGEYLQTDAGLSRPEALGFRDVRAALLSLIQTPTARLERIFAEHLDLCSYRLDAWQSGFFNRRLQQLRFPVESEGAFAGRVQGLYLGAFGWLEDLRPAPDLVPVDPESVPVVLHDPLQDGPLFEQPDNAGFIHGPSLNHAVAAAVLRNAYISHFDPGAPEKMATNLSSERVRTALSFLEGIRNGQELGALLGYQFERGLHDRHGDPSLNQYIPLFRAKYPLLADKITPGKESDPIESKEARNVFDGFALLEVAFLKDEQVRLNYPYGVDGLPDPGSGSAAERKQAEAISAEVSRMADSFDAIADLALAEGVFQATQGNFDRAGAMLKAFTEGNNPVEPEIVRTPRSGVALTQRVALHLETGAVTATPWPGVGTPRAEVEPGLNLWLANLLPPPDKIQYHVRIGGADPEPQSLKSLGLQPIDLVYLIGDDLANETTELERRIACANQHDPGESFSIEFMTGLPDPEGITLFEVLPLLRNLRELVTGCRPLAAVDFRLPSEMTSDVTEDPNPMGIDFADHNGRMESLLARFDSSLQNLGSAIPPPDAAGIHDLNAVDPQALRDRLLTLANFGLSDAVPLSASGGSDEAKSLLLDQALRTMEIAHRKMGNAAGLIAAGNDPAQSADARLASFRAAAQEILGPAFNLIPVFGLKNPAELQAAADFRDADPALGLTRHHRDNPHIVAEWLQGVARVREKIGNLETVSILSQALGSPQLEVHPLQVPFRQGDHWVAVAYPDAGPEAAGGPGAFVPEGDFLSIVQHLAAGSFDPGEPQSGLLLDEWIEVIPGRTETTGIAIHYDQPSTEPPQALLLAVTPEVTGAWTWDKLVGTLQNTFDRAQLRAVEPDLLSRTAFGHLLPALLSAVATHPHATISTDFVDQTAKLAFDT